MNHILNDPSFHRRPEDAAEYTQHLQTGLRSAAAKAYRQFLDANIPEREEDWDFGDVVKLGKAVVNLCSRIKKRYNRNPVVMGASPFQVLVETMFPSFENDAKAFIERVVQVAKDRDREIEVEDGFALYRELVEIRKIHIQNLPKEPFAFHIEGLLAEFVWKLIKNAESRMEDYVENAIKQDQFQVRTQDADSTPADSDRHSVSVIDMFQLFNQSVDQIAELQWDDDVHYAKFMTALAKGFASGIGKYCEIVEQRFAKEMDRATAQEVAAATKTTQEKFLQYAKDAWSNKEKIEPFQFYPEVSLGASRRAIFGQRQLTRGTVVREVEQHRICDASTG
jgi:hypothetical protein